MFAASKFGHAKPVRMTDDHGCLKSKDIVSSPVSRRNKSGYMKVRVGLKGWGMRYVNQECQ